MTKFSNNINLCKSWPSRVEIDAQMGVDGYFLWSYSYFSAAESLLQIYSEKGDFSDYCGPVLHNVGLATELALKTLLRGSGHSSNDLKRYSHNTYEAYLHARGHFDEEKFINLHVANTQHIEIPAEIKERLVAAGEREPDLRWRVFFDHLRLLDTVYDRPYRTRYITPGDITLPDAEIILIGVKILLQAMKERM